MKCVPFKKGSTVARFQKLLYYFHEYKRSKHVYPRFSLTWSFAMISTFPCCITPTHEYVVPRSMPTAGDFLAIAQQFYFSSIGVPTPVAQTRLPAPRPTRRTFNCDRGSGTFVRFVQSGGERPGKGRGCRDDAEGTGVVENCPRSGRSAHGAA